MFTSLSPIFKTNLLYCLLIFSRKFCTKYTSLFVNFFVWNTLYDIYLIVCDLIIQNTRDLIRNIFFQEHVVRDLLWQDPRHRQRPSLRSTPVGQQAAGRTPERSLRCVGKEKRSQVGVTRRLLHLLLRTTETSKKINVLFSPHFLLQNNVLFIIILSIACP